VAREKIAGDFSTAMKSPRVPRPGYRKVAAAVAVEVLPPPVSLAT
jgi:hypothetical protein